MTGFRAQTRGIRQPGAFGWAALLCLTVLLLFTVVQVAHVHAVESDADHCPLCIVMHAATPVAIAAVAIVLVRLAAPAPVHEEARAAVRMWHPTLFNRPPPAGC